MGSSAVGPHHRRPQPRSGFPPGGIWASCSPRGPTGEDPKHVTVTKEIGDEARSRPLVQALRFVALHHLAAVQDRDAAAHGQGFLLVVGDIAERSCLVFLGTLASSTSIARPYLLRRAPRAAHRGEACAATAPAPGQAPPSVARRRSAWSRSPRRDRQGVERKVDHLGDARADLRARHPADFQAVRRYSPLCPCRQNTAYCSGTSCRGCAPPGRHPRDVLSIDLDLLRNRARPGRRSCARSSDFPDPLGPRKVKNSPAADGQGQPVGGDCPSKPLRRDDRSSRMTSAIWRRWIGSMAAFRIAAGTIAISTARMPVASSIDGVSARWREFEYSLLLHSAQEVRHLAFGR